jgi:hypothetical protein
MTTPVRPRPPLSRRRRLLFALVPVLVLLLGAELIIRLVRAPLHFGSFRQLRTDLMRRNYPAELHPTLGYAPKPNFASRDNHWGTQVSIDADGMRRNGAGPGPAGERVIAVVGDSFTFGDEVDDDATWPAALERILDLPVKNGGVFGYSLTQAVLRAEALLERFQVSTLVVSFIPDDLTRCEFAKRYTLLPVFRPDGDGLRLEGPPLDHAGHAADATKAWKDALGHSALVDAVLANTVRHWWFENEKQVTADGLAGLGPELGRRLIDRIAARCRERGTALLVVLQGQDDLPAGRAVLAHAASRGVRTVDLVQRYLDARTQDPSVQQRWFRGHMTREGNEWAAKEIAAALRAGG